MPITEHLEELRKTVIRIGLIVFITFIASYSFGDVISEYLLSPLRDALKAGATGNVVYLGILDKVLSQLQVAFWSSAILSSPLWFFEVWRFLRPGLYEHEAKMVRPFIIVGFILFTLGICFAYFIVFPLTFQLLLEFGVKDVAATISLKDYLILASKALLFFGLVFQLPNVLLILGFMGLVTKQSLRKMRRYIYVVFAIISAMITPPDVVSMLGLWLPLTLLFEVGIWAVALIVHPYLERQHSS